MKTEAFRIDVDQAVLDDLHVRLRQTKWGAGPHDDSWSFGTQPAYLRELVAYWLDGYDWRKQEAALNELPQFEADVGAARIHFVHQRAADPTAMPLLLLHGWPDSFARFGKVIPRLTMPDDPKEAFDVVVPSLPGFAFTGRVPRASDWQPTRESAELIYRLMTEVLGYRRFGVAGGDGGSVIAQIMALDHPRAVMGIHLTDLGWQVARTDPMKVSRSAQRYLGESKKHFMAEGAYAMLHTTKPKSLAPALHDSPVGLAAWLVDRFHSWSGSTGFTKDELLTEIMIYWVTQTLGSSIETYRDDAMSPSLTPDDRVHVPVGLALFPNDVGGIPPRSLAERTLNVQRWSEMPRGGHFAALEEPDLYAQELRAFFRDLSADDRATLRRAP